MIAVDTQEVVAREPDVRSGRLGGVILRWDKFTASEARATSDRMRTWALSTPSRLPFWIGTDHEGGAVFTQRLYGLPAYPGNMALGAAGSPRLTEQSYRAMSRGLRALGIHVDFAPDLDVADDPASLVVGIRSFGDDPAAVARHGAAAVRGMKQGGVLGVIKHFPGHGGTGVDSHFRLPLSGRTRAELESAELVPFRAAIAAGAEAVMPAHMVFPALGSADRPVTLSSAALEGVLRGRMGFKGLIVSDDLSMGAIARVHSSSEAAVMALEAGNDLLLFVGRDLDFPATYSAVIEAARSGRLSRSRLERSASRVLQAKRRLGLFSGDADRHVPEEERTAHRAVARRAAEAAVTLVRNDGILPLRLRPDQTLGLVTVRPRAYEKEMAAFAAEVAERHPRLAYADVTDVLPSTAAVHDALEAVRGSSAVIVATFRYHATLRSNQWPLLRGLIGGHAPVIAVSLMNPWDLEKSTGAAAAVAIYGITGHSLETAARVIFGEARPKGRLPVTIPGAYPRGHGLTRP